MTRTPVHPSRHQRHSGRLRVRLLAGGVVAAGLVALAFTPSTAAAAGQVTDPGSAPSTQALPDKHYRAVDIRRLPAGDAPEVAWIADGRPGAARPLLGRGRV